MARSKTLQLENALKPDNLAVELANRYVRLEQLRSDKVEEWKEIQKYVFATDTTKTTNAKLPWNNKTTIPKLCQIRDNLHANYMATLFPKRKWLMWEGKDREDETKKKKEAIEGYMLWSFDRSGFYEEMEKIILDYIDYGNCFVMPYWKDERMTKSDGSETVGYVGPAIRRINPVDIVFDPTASSFESSPKIIRSFVTLGEVKNMMEDLSVTEEKKAEYQELWNYMRETRSMVQAYNGTVQTKDEIYNVGGFNSYRDYLLGDYVEVLTFYGDLYDRFTDTLLQNHVIKIVDRHKVLCKNENESVFGHAPIYHAGWRIRPDNIWAMGPLDNLIGMQYRIDHLENLKSDIMDFTAFPVFKVKGYVEDFEWKPMERIIIGDDGDVAILAPDVGALQYESQIQVYEQKMEEMAGAPKEAMGFRTPGEKTKYEVQRLELAGGRIFQSKTGQFERQVVEPLINSELELARRNLDKVTIRSFDTEFKVADFKNLTIEDITGNGLLKPIAARHFAEQANMVQNLSAFFGSGAASEGVMQHFSSERLARLWEEVLEIGDYKIVSPYVMLSEQADAQRIAQSLQEQVAVEAQTPAGIQPEDYDQDVMDEPLPEEEANPEMAF
jgi:hypothetical protein